MSSIKFVSRHSKTKSLEKFQPELRTVGLRLNNFKRLKSAHKISFSVKKKYGQMRFSRNFNYSVFACSLGHNFLTTRKLISQKNLTREFFLYLPQLLLILRTRFHIFQILH